MIRAVAWLRANEPVRALLYTVLAAVVGYLVVNGTIHADVAQQVIAVLALVLAVPATEAIRGAVTPNGRVPVAAAAAAHQALDDIENVIGATFGASGANVVREARERIERGPRYRGA